MTKVPRQPIDPATLAESVREVAYEARRVLADPTRTAFETRALARRTTLLGRQVPAGPQSDLARWLNNLSQALEHDEDRLVAERREAGRATGVGAC